MDSKVHDLLTKFRERNSFLSISIALSNYLLQHITSPGLSSPGNHTIGVPAQIFKTLRTISRDLGV